MTSISILGAGAWGTALACAISHDENNVTLYTHDKEELGYLQKNNASPKLPDIALPPSIQVTGKLEDTLPADIVMIAVPAQAVRDVCMSMAPLLTGQSYVVLCSKGIELETGLLMNEVAESLLKDHAIAVLSGPTFAKEVAQGLATAATIAHGEMTSARFLASTLGSQKFRLYPSTDCTGVELGGAMKNIIAIASGIAMAQKMGENTRAALITRGLNEMVRLGIALGANPETFLGLSGIGDLILSCTSTQSRNFSLGLEIGQGTGSSFAMSGVLTEGAYTVKALLKLAEMMEVEVPICQAVHAVLHEGQPIDQEIEGLLARPFKVEFA